MTNEELIAKLDEKIPRDAISLRDGGGNRKLSYLEGWYVIDRLNKVLGPGNWAYRSEVTNVEKETKQDKYNKEVYSVHYIAKVHLLVTLNDKQTEFTDYGYGDGTDRGGYGKCHELAVKEAVTDGLKRCAKNLGMSFGLALYDKSQENVADEANEANEAPKVVTPATAPIPENMPDVLRLISSTAKVLEAKKKMTTSQIRDTMKTKYNVATKEELTPEQAKQFLQFLKEQV